MATDSNEAVPQPPFEVEEYLTKPLDIGPGRLLPFPDTALTANQKINNLAMEHAINRDKYRGAPISLIIEDAEKVADFIRTWGAS